MKKNKSDKFVVYVTGRPEGSDNTPYIAIFKCNDCGKMTEEPIARLDPWDAKEIGQIITAHSEQYKDYKSKGGK